MTKLERFTEDFKKTFPKAWFRVGDFYGNGKTIFWTGEDAYDNNGLPMIDYWNEYGMDTINADADALAEKHGFYFECHDPGTMTLTEF